MQAGSDHAELAALAVKHARDGRGVAHLVLPDEVQALPSDGTGGLPGGPLLDAAGRPGRRRPGPAPPSWSRDARRPVIVVGHGARGARDEVVALAEQLGAPVLTTFKAKGLVPDTHPLGAGVLGRSGTPVASWLMNEADLLLVVGASFSNHTGIAPYKPIVQVDDTPTAIGRFDAVTADLLGDAALVVPALAAPSRTRAPSAEDQRADVAERWAIWRAEKARRVADDRGRGGLGGGRVRRAVRAPARRRRGRRRRRQPRLLAGPLPRVEGPAGADVGLPRLDRVRLPGRDGRLGRRPRTGRSWR